ncbi:MAG: glycoside hydrolase family 48 protein [Oscillospiraceae bacterium]|nr:glycoside hydrolase family 48 protein [Oscillospiraceae bacterium]
MVLKKNTKKLVAFAMSLSLLATAASPLTASAVYNGIEGRTIAEKFGDDTYKNMFLSLYDDVVTNGTKNGYLSDEGVPYHAIETVIVEAPDYGHETTSEAMSYLVWIASMKDNLSGTSGELAKAWKVMETMIPDVQPNFMKTTTPSATYSDEWEEPTMYPTDMATGNNGLNPIHKYFSSAYSSDDGLYLLHWLADVDNWYGYGQGTDFTFINTFQRGEQESCFETIPQGCVEELKFGNERGIKGIFTTESQPAQQYAYTNAPDAEGRAIQAVYWANRWGVGDSSITTKAGKMADELRNDMFDKYYKKIGETTTKNDQSAGYDGCHYLMSWYTSWGGGLKDAWTWQIGCSHSHQFYQNVMQAYAVLNDNGLNSAMKAEGATKDWTESLERQIQMYEWLQSSNGPFAGGCTNSWKGRYETYPSGISTFYGMAYVEHPVYADPGSNGWIGNQVWSAQRICELYYVAVKDGKTELAARLEKMLTKWADWFTANIKFNYDNNGETMPFAIPTTLEWSGQPDKWTGTKSDNSGLTCTVKNYGSSDVGCISSLSNGLLYYAAAQGVDGKPGSTAGTASGIKAFNTAKKLIDIEWQCYRDNVGVSFTEDNGSLKRIFEEEVWVPDNYGTGKMPSGDTIKQGIKFIDIRTNYRDDSTFKELEDYYNANGKTEGFELNYHRFWHVGDMLMALGTMATLFPDVEVAPEDTYEIGKEVEKPISDKVEEVEPPVTTPVVTTTTPAPVTTPKPGDNLYGDVDLNGTVELTDLTTLSQYLIHDIKQLSDQALINADVTGDNDVNLADLMHLKQFIGKENVILGPQPK